MSRWTSKSAQRVFGSLHRLGWQIKEEKGFARVQLLHDNYPEATWSFCDSEKLGPKMLARLARSFHFEPRHLR